MNDECQRIADQLFRAFNGDAWHGPSLREILDGIEAEQAAAHPLPSAHSIWELMLHIDLWAHIGYAATIGIPMPKLYGTEKDWTTPFTGSEDEWSAAKVHLFDTAEHLADAVQGFSDERLTEIVPGRDYDFYYLFHGVVQHSLYHAGQIAMLKRAVRLPESPA
jgi:DinB superfamily